MWSRRLWLLSACSALIGTVLPAEAPPAHVANWLALLQQAAPENNSLHQAVATLLRADPVRLDPEPALLVVTYRARGAEVRDVVAQLYDSPPADVAAVLNPAGTVRNRLGDDLGDSADSFLGLLGRPANYLGSAAEVNRQQRAFNATFAGDLTLLREQTVEPLHVIAILPQAGRYLPGSLASRVKSLVVTAELDFGEWRARLGLLTDNPDAAEQVGNVVAAWRELAGSLAEMYAGYSSGRHLREALSASKVEVTGNQVTATGVIPAATVVRVAKEAAGHGGGCPAGAPCDRTKVAVCHNPGRQQITLCLAPAAVATFLAHGDYCGPCRPLPPPCPPGAPCARNKVAICHKQHGRPDQTLCVDASTVAGYLAQGDSCGPCRTGGGDHGDDHGHDHGDDKGH
jgi:hypothetical protein